MTSGRRGRAEHAVNTHRHGDNAVLLHGRRATRSEDEEGGGGGGDLQQQTHSLWAVSIFHISFNIQ